MGRLGRGQSLIAMARASPRRRPPRRGDDGCDRRRGLADRVGHRLLRSHRGLPVACSTSGVRRNGRRHWNAGGESQPDMVPFRGNCLVYRAELMRFHGAWGDAADEAQRAREWLSRPPPEPAVGEAIYQLAELDRLRGAFEAAEAGYREAGTWGRLPEPGLALLRLAQGDVAAASAAIRRAMAEATDEMVRARMLEPAVEIAACGRRPGQRSRRGRSTRPRSPPGSMRRCSVRWPPGPTAPCGSRKATSRVRWRCSGGHGRRGASSMPRTKRRVSGS